VFDSSELQGGEPVQFIIGNSNMISGFEQAVIGMRVNETKDVHILSDDAYGPYDDSMVVTVNWSSFEEGFVPEVGERIQLRNSAGQTFQGIVLNTSEEGVTVDLNSPMAGKDLNFEITMVEIVPAPTTATLQPGVTPDLQNVVEVIYTHRTNRCASCVWAEDNLRRTIDTYFADEVANGKLIFMTINIEDGSNIAIVNKLGAYSSQMFINKIVDGEEEIEEMTSLYLLIYNTQAYSDAAKALIEERLE
jgi:peptidylprolyl isomerase